MSANDRQVGGTHYKMDGEEHWDRVARLGLDYFQGQITKYVERCKLKNGVQDLEKARHFLDKYIELNSGTPGTTVDKPKLDPARSVPGYTYEGGYGTHEEYRCTKCKTQFKIDLHTDPRGQHECPV